MPTKRKGYGDEQETKQDNPMSGQEDLDEQEAKQDNILDNVLKLIYKPDWLPVGVVVIALICYYLFFGLSSTGNNAQDVVSLRTTVDNLSNEFSKMKTIQNDVKQYKNELKGHKESMKQYTEAEVNGMNEKISRVEKSVSFKAESHDVDTKTAQITGQLKRLEGEFTETVEGMKRLFDEKATQLDFEIEQKEKAIKNAQDSLHKLQEDTNKKMEKYESQMSLLDKTIEDDLKNNIRIFKKQVQEINQAKKEADEILNLIKSDVERIFPNTFNKPALTAAFLFLTFLVFCLAFWIYRVQCSITPCGPQNQQMNPPVLHDNSICIVSFDEARRGGHFALLSTTWAAASVTRLEYFVVRRHEHLDSLPNCKFYIMCTEFSERHVIIEEPGIGLGDLKKCTYEAIQRKGVPMVIVYTRDPGSRNLGDSLYNQRIHCVATQPELSTLRDRDRFFSTYDALTEQQKNSLAATIANSLR